MNAPNWSERRDMLEKYYPTCMSFCRYHASYPDGLVERLSRGVLFLIAFWSGPAVMRFKSACYVLEGVDFAERCEFHIVDVDGLEEKDTLFDEHQRLGGFGEAFWIQDGRIISSMGREWSIERFEDLTCRLIDGG